MGSLKVMLCGIELDNPVIPASGTFGYGYSLQSYMILTNWVHSPSKEQPKTPALAIPLPGLPNAPPA